MTAVEWLFDKLHIVDKEYGISQYYFEQAIQMEKEQLKCAWNSSDQNMRFQFSSSAYKPITFKQWLEQFKQEKES